MGDALMLVCAIGMIGLGVGMMSIPWSLIVIGSIVLVLTMIGGMMKGPK